MFKNLSLFLKQSFPVDQRKYGWINIARGIIIIMVVYRHAFEGLRNSGVDLSPYYYYEVLNKLMYTFRMPLFFVISGVLMNPSIKNLGLEAYLRKRASYILYPYLVWTIIQISLQALMPQFANEKSGWNTYLSIIYNPREIEQFWYLHALFTITVIYAVVKTRLKIPPHIHILVGLVLFLFEQYTARNSIRLYFLGDVFAFYLFFGLGDQISRFLLNKENHEKIASIRLLFLNLPIFIALHYYYLLNPSLIQHAFVLLIALSGIVLILNVSFILDEKGEFRLLKLLGQNSLTIYLLHVMMMAASRVVMLRILHIDNPQLLLPLTIIIGILGPLVAHYMLLKGGFWWLFHPQRSKSTVKPALIVNNETSVS